MRKFEEIIGKFPQIKQNRQAMTKIAFTSNIYREAFAMIGRGFAMAVKETGRVVNKAIHEWPYAFMFAEALVLVVIAFAYVGQARAERDYASKRFVDIQAKADSLEVASDMWHNVAKGGLQ